MPAWRRSLLPFVFGALTLLFVPAGAAAQEGGESGHGDVFGDLVHIKRDPATGQPILQKRWIEYPMDVFDWGYCPIPVDRSGQEIPFLDLTCDVDPNHLTRLVDVDYFGRLSAGRTKERNSRMHFDEVIDGIKAAELLSLDPVGRVQMGTGCVEGVCAEWKVVDSPQQSLALYARLLRYGHIQTNPLEADVDFHGDPETGTVYHPALGLEDWPKFTGVLSNLLPSGSCFSGATFNAACALPQALTDEDFVRAASFLGGAADKHGKVTMDLVQYLNRILKITKATDYSLPTLNTVPALIRDENGVIAPAPDGLPAPADERFVNFAAAAYTREARFNRPMPVALVETAPGSGQWLNTPNLSLLPFLRFINGTAVPLTGGRAFVANAHDAVRAVEFVHNYEVPADIRAPGAYTTTTVAPQVAGLSGASQVLIMMATIVDEVPVNGGTVTFMVQKADGTGVGAPVTSAPVVNGMTMADFVLDPISAPGVLTIVGAYSGAAGFAPSYGVSTLTITDDPAGECVAVINPTTAVAPPEGGTATVQLTIGPTCAWTADSSAAWLIPTATSGTGSAGIEYTTERNLTGAPRTAYLNINGMALVVTQQPWQAQEVSDFNGDGYADIVWQHTDGRVVIWFMNGVTRLGWVELPFSTGDANLRVAAVADFNLDGGADILLQHQATKSLSVWLMYGTDLLSIESFIDPAPGTSWSVVGVDDVNGDAFVDLVWQDSASGETVAWLMDGFTRDVVLPMVPGVASTEWATKEVADFNADGDRDLVWQHGPTGVVQVFLLTGGAVTNTQYVMPLNSDPSWSVVGAADISRDGQTDLVWQHADGRVVVWYMNNTAMTNWAFVVAEAGNPGWRIAAIR